MKPSAPGPGPGSGQDRDPDRAALLHARIGIVATIVIGQLWGLTVALNAWFEGAGRLAAWLVAFQALSFALALVVWLAAPGER